MRRSKESETYQLLHEYLTDVLLDDLKIQYQASLKIISNHLATLSGLLKKQVTKGSKEYKKMVNAYNSGLIALREIEKSVKELETILDKSNKRKS